LKIEGGFGGRAGWGGQDRCLAITVMVTVVAVTSGGGLGCTYDYNSLMGPQDSPDGGAASGGSRASGGAPGTGGESATGSGGTGSGGVAGGTGGTG